MILNLVLIVIFILLLAHYIFFLMKILSGLNKLEESTSVSIPEEFISVIIPFRNEEKNILVNLKSIENQDYPKEKFEVIYIDDSSEDNSLKLLQDNKIADYIKVLSVPEKFSVNAHKKRAVRYGIENSSGQIIVTTDADCVHEKKWLSSLVSYLDDATGFVSGPVEFIDGQTLFSKIQKLEFAGLIITGAGLIGAGSPTICNAANIAYRKKVFDEVGGFKNQMDLSSGDDELLMQKIAKDTDYKVRFSVNKNSIVKTHSNKNIAEFYHQRKRWASKGLFYGDRSLIVKLILIFLFYIGLIFQPVLAITLSSYFYISLVASILLKSVFEYLILTSGKKILFNDLSLKPFLIAEFLQVPYIIIAGFLGAFGNLKWKERKIKR
jgi:cellulose synthase/poly-beta-1,6-N-acetylglucosamine synthase-like glycosyltransferase